MICGESCRLGRGRRLSKILSAGPLGFFFSVELGYGCKFQNASRSQFREVRERCERGCELGYSLRLLWLSF